MSDERKDRRTERKDELRPHHDEPTDRVPYETEKALFDRIIEEAKDG